MSIAVDEIKQKVLGVISGGMPITMLPKAKCNIDGNIIHIRFRSNPKTDGRTYAFNINPNTLASDYELWICGSIDVYYLIPISEITEIYENPDTYPDKQHPEIRVVDIDVTNHRCLFGRGHLSQDFSRFFKTRVN